MSRILVTGANGFIGSHLCARLLHEGHEVASLTRTNSDLMRFDLLKIKPQRYSVASYCEGELKNIFTDFKPDLVFHLASNGIRRSQHIDIETLRMNVVSTAELVQTCVASQVKRIILMGSGFEYAPSDMPNDENQPLEPFSFYGATKAAAWQMGRFFSQHSTCEVVLARLFTTYGPTENIKRIYPYVMTMALKNEKIKMSSGEQIRDYLHVDEVVEALLVIAKTPGLNGQVINICSGEEISIRQIAELIVEEAQRTASILDLGALPTRANEPMYLVGDSRKLQNLGWRRKYTSREGIARTLNWYREYESVWEKLP